MIHCKECGQDFPLGLWLAQNPHRTLWTTVELVSRYGSGESALGREMSRLGAAVHKPMRVGPRGKRGYKSVVYFLAQPTSLKLAFASAASFLNAKLQVVRQALLRERFAESYARVPAARDAFARLAVTIESQHV